MRAAALIAALVAAVLGAVTPAAAQTEVLTSPTFGRVAIYAPATTPTAVVLFLSGDGGWTGSVVSIAERLRDRGALVVGIDVRSFVRGLEESQACAYPAGDLEELSRNVQLHHKLAAYRRPILVGYSSGATLAYAAIVSAPRETFAGAISLSFCPDLTIRTPLCEMRGLHARKRTDRRYVLAPDAGLKVPWTVLQGDGDRVCTPTSTRAFTKATGSARIIVLRGVGHVLNVPGNWEGEFLNTFAEASAERPDETIRVSIPAVADLSVVEVPATGGPSSDLMAVVFSGDGGWAELDKGVAAALAAAGVPSIGWSSLRYYWTPRTPDKAAADLARIIAHYTTAWNKRRVLLVGYSFGADVVPFLVTRLPPDVRARIAGVGLLGLSPTATFEFHLAEWFGGGATTEYLTVPEVERLSVPVTCVRGAGESDSACSSLRGANIAVVTVGEGHHFSDEYQRLAEAILRHL